MYTLDRYFVKQDARYKHCLRVGEKLKEIFTLKASELSLSQFEEKNLIDVATLHEVGFCETTKSIDYPPIDSFLELRSLGFDDSFCKAVLFMSNAEEIAVKKGLINAVRVYQRVHEYYPLTDKEKFYVDLLTFADLTTSSTGEDISLDKAHAQNKYFYGPSSPEAMQFIHHFVDLTMLKMKFSI